jgi:hypothetical protein
MILVHDDDFARLTGPAAAAMMVLLVHIHPLLLLCCRRKFCKFVSVLLAVVLCTYVVPVCCYEQVNSLALYIGNKRR